MATPGIVRSVSTRNVKKLEKPRPLKQSLSTDNARVNTTGLDNLMLMVESVSQNIINYHYDDNLRTNISNMNNFLKSSGSQLELVYKDQLDRAFVSFRNGTRDEQLDYRSRLYLLELIELRAKNWQVSDYLQSYYNAKMQCDLEIISRDQGISPSLTVQTVTPTLAPGEVLKNSGKFVKPTKIPGKNYCKDEVVIRNSDSGKVNPGAKERLVQITGPTEDKILHARQLMEDTIRRNASPVREMCERERMGGSSSSLNSSASDESNRLPFTGRGGNGRTLLHSLSTPDASIGEYKYSVTVGNDTIKITGTNHELVRTAKLVLDEHFGPELYQNFRSDCYTHFEEDVFTTNSHAALTKRLGSLDSGNGGPSNSSSGDIEGGIGVNRQNLFSTSRPVLSRSASVHSQDFKVTDNNSLNKKKRLEYSVEFLMKCLNSPLTKLPPADWDRISKDFPAVVKQVAPFLLPTPPTPPLQLYNQSPRRHSENDTTSLVYSYSSAWNPDQLNNLLAN